MFASATQGGHNKTNTRSMVPFPGQPGKPAPEGKTILDFNEVEITGWHWHQLDHMQITCTLLQIVTMPTSHQSDFFTGRMLFLTPDQQCQSTEGKKQNMNMETIRFAWTRTANASGWMRGRRSSNSILMAIFQVKLGQWLHFSLKISDMAFFALLISPDRVAPSGTVGVSAYVIFPCTIKSRRRFVLAPAHINSPGKRAIKRLCVCVCGCPSSKREKDNGVPHSTHSSISVFIFSFFITGSIAHSASRRYLIHWEADFEVFRPTGATRCTDGGEIWHGGCQMSPPSVQRQGCRTPKTEIFTQNRPKCGI